MNKWYKLNPRGRFLYILCWLNLASAISMAMIGDWICILSTLVAILCALATFDNKYLNFYENEEGQ